MRKRDTHDIVDLFRDAVLEDADIALKLLFYIGDIREGQGERKFFKTCLRYLAAVAPNSLRKNMEHIPFFTRWDYLYTLVGTPLEEEAFALIANQFKLDMECDTPSLLGKWLKSENASSSESKRLGKITREYLDLNPKEYRKALSSLREKIKVVEKLMSENRWNEIEFDKLPSKAGFVYRNAFARRDILKERYKEFAADENTKVNADTLYPHEIAMKIYDYSRSNIYVDDEGTERNMLNKYWDNQKDYFHGRGLNILCMADTSDSMRWNNPALYVSVALATYTAERCNGEFKGHYITFSSSPKLVEVKGMDAVDKITTIFKNTINDNTNIDAAFELVLGIACELNLTQEQLPDVLAIISDMQFDECDGSFPYGSSHNEKTLIPRLQKRWAQFGYRLPHIVFWNASQSARNVVPATLGMGDISFVSGMSPSIYDSILSMKTGYELMLEVVNKERYKCITF